MITEHVSGGRTVWIDLYNPTNDEIAKACTDYNLEIPPREQQNPASLAAQQKADIEKWWPIIRAAGIKQQ